MMKRCDYNKIRIVFLICVLWYSFSAFSQKREVLNPIIPGFAPDPTICRLGDDYYLCNSSFTWFPAIPIYQSKNLITWELVGHAIDRPGMVSLDHLKDKDGIWAPTLRHHNGLWYIFCNISNKGNFFMTAKNIRGPWSNPVWVKVPGIDPSVFWDEDGKSYIIGNDWNCPQFKFKASTVIWIQGIDLKTGELAGERHYLSTGYAFDARHAEGPHLYKIGKKYVLMIAEGGTNFFHSEVILISDKLFGPYRSQMINPVLSQRQFGKTCPIQCVGHADLVQTQYGDWYAVALGKRMIEGKYAFSRETFLCPVEIQDGEFVFNPGKGGMTEKILQPDLPPVPVATIPSHDDFNDSISRGWYFERIPDQKFYTVSKGRLLLKLLPESIDSLVSPALLMRMNKSMQFSGTTRLIFSTNKKNEHAGLVLLRNNQAYVSIIKTASSLQVITRKGNEKKMVVSIPCRKTSVYLRMKVTGSQCIFEYGTDLSKMKIAGETSLVPLSDDNLLNRFNGLGIGLYASSDGHKSNNRAAFDFYDYDDESYRNF